MKIMAINGSPNASGYTAKLIDVLLDQCRNLGAECEKINLEDYEIDGCRNCNCCSNVGECIREDDFIHLKANIYEADGIIIGSPYYDGGATDLLRTLFIRFSKSGSKEKILDGKYILGLSLSGSCNGRQLAEYCANFGEQKSKSRLKISSIISLKISQTNDIIEITNDTNLKKLVKKTSKNFIKDIKRKRSKLYLKVRRFICKFTDKLCFVSLFFR